MSATAPEPRSAEEWAAYWDCLQRCPHDPKHDNEKEYPSAEAYNACLAEFFKAFAAQECAALQAALTEALENLKTADAGWLEENNLAERFRTQRDALQQRVEALEGQPINALKTALGDSTMLLQDCARRLGDLVTIPEQVGKNKATLRGGGTG